MRNKIMKISFCFISVVIIFVGMCPISAFAYDSQVFYVNISKPTVSNNSGYFEILWQDNSTGSQFVDVRYFTFTPSTNGSSEFLSSADQLITKVTVSSSEVLFTISVPEYVWGYYSSVGVSSRGDYSITAHALSDDGGSVTYRTSRNGYTLVGFRYYGNVAEFTNYLSSNEIFYVSYSEDTVLNFHLADIVTSLNSISSSIGDSNSEIKSSLDTLVSDLNSFEGSFSEFVEYYKSKMTILLSYCEDYFTQLKTLIENTDDVEGLLEAISVTLTQLEMYMFDVWIEQYNHTSELQALNEKLQSILDILNQKSDTEFTTQDPTQFDEYYDVENSLLDNDNVNVSDVVNVEVNQNALTVIWDYVERALNSHGKVFGMVLTILALGIIALILGR